MITARALQAANQLKSKSGGGDGRPAFREAPREPSGHPGPLLEAKQILDQHNEPGCTFSIGRYKRPWAGTGENRSLDLVGGLDLRGTISAPSWAPGPPTRSPAFSSRV